MHRQIRHQIWTVVDALGQLCLQSGGINGKRDGPRTHRGCFQCNIWPQCQTGGPAQGGRQSLQRAGPRYMDDESHQGLRPQTCMMNPAPLAEEKAMVMNCPFTSGGCARRTVMYDGMGG